MKIQASAENYLETILVLSKRNKLVRSVDIAEELGFSKPSISRAMGLLRKNGYILMEDSGAITLTESGKKIAEDIYERHRLIGEFLIKIGVSEKTAAADACRIEHVISPESFERLKEHMKRA